MFAIGCFSRNIAYLLDIIRKAKSLNLLLSILFLKVILVAALRNLFSSFGLKDLIKIRHRRWDLHVIMLSKIELIWAFWGVIHYILTALFLIGEISVRWLKRLCVVALHCWFGYYWLGIYGVGVPFRLAVDCLVLHLVVCGVWSAVQGRARYVALDLCLLEGALATPTVALVAHAFS